MSEQPSHRIISSRGEFHEALRAAFAQVAEVGCREIFISDPDFADWPLGDRAVVDHLTQWAAQHRKLTVLARHFDEVTRRHARWAEWRRQWSHVVECRSLADDAPGLSVPVPTVFLAPGLVTIRLWDAVHYRASVSQEEADAVRVRDTLDALLQHSEVAFPPTTLGL